MTTTPFIRLAEDVSSWADLESRIIALPTEQERGQAFEEFCRHFFILDPVFQFREVYRQQEIPLSVRQRLGYPGIQDIGIDGLYVKCKMPMGKQHQSIGIAEPNAPEALRARSHGSEQNRGISGHEGPLLVVSMNNVPVTSRKNGGCRVRLVY